MNMVHKQFKLFDVAAGLVRPEDIPTDRPNASEEDIRAHIERRLLEGQAATITTGSDLYELREPSFEDIRGSDGSFNSLKSNIGYPISALNFLSLNQTLAALVCLASLFLFTTFGAGLKASSAIAERDKVQRDHIVALKNLEKAKHDYEEAERAYKATLVSLGMLKENLQQTQKDLDTKTRAYNRDTIWVEKAKTALREVSVLLSKYQSVARENTVTLTTEQSGLLIETIKVWQEQLTSLERHPVFKGDKSKFVQDVNFPDDSKLDIGQKFTKSWEIANIGTEPWNGRFLMREDPNDAKGKLLSAKRVPIPNTLPGENCTISVDLEAPSQLGPCYAEWKMVDANGRYLMPAQQPLFVLFEVIARKP